MRRWKAGGARIQYRTYACLALAPFESTQDWSQYGVAARGRASPAACPRVGAGVLAPAAGGVPVVDACRSAMADVDVGGHGKRGLGARDRLEQELEPRRVARGGGRRLPDPRQLRARARGVPALQCGAQGEPAAVFVQLSATFAQPVMHARRGAATPTEPLAVYTRAAGARHDGCSGSQECAAMLRMLVSCVGVPGGTRTALLCPRVN